jgi:hypothetical protein
LNTLSIGVLSDKISAISSRMPQLRQLLEATDLERRIVVLEAAAADDPDWPRANCARRYVSAN